MTPTLLASGRVRPRKAVGTEASKFAVAVAASVGFFVALDMSMISLVVVTGMLVGGIIAAPVTAWLVRRVPPRILGVSVSGLIILTNGPRALESIGLAPAAESAILAAVAVAWVSAIVVVLSRRCASQANATGTG